MHFTKRLSVPCHKTHERHHGPHDGKELNLPRRERTDAHRQQRSHSLPYAYIPDHSHRCQCRRPRPNLRRILQLISATHRVCHRSPGDMKRFSFWQRAATTGLRSVERTTTSTPTFTEHRQTQAHRRDCTPQPPHPIPSPTPDYQSIHRQNLTPLKPVSPESLFFRPITISFP